MKISIFCIFLTLFSSCKTRQPRPLDAQLKPKNLALTEQRKYSYSTQPIYLEDSKSAIVYFGVIPSIPPQPGSTRFLKFIPIEGTARSVHVDAKKDSWKDWDEFDHIHVVMQPWLLQHGKSIADQTFDLSASGERNEGEIAAIVIGSVGILAGVGLGAYLTKQAWDLRDTPQAKRTVSTPNIKKTKTDLSSARNAGPNLRKLEAPDPTQARRGGADASPQAAPRQQSPGLPPQFRGLTPEQMNHVQAKAAAELQRRAQNADPSAVNSQTSQPGVPLGWSDEPPIPKEEYRSWADRAYQWMEDHPTTCKIGKAAAATAVVVGGLYACGMLPNAAAFGQTYALGNIFNSASNFVWGQSAKAADPSTLAKGTDVPDAVYHPNQTIVSANQTSPVPSRYSPLIELNKPANQPTGANFNSSNATSTATEQGFTNRSSPTSTLVESNQATGANFNSSNATSTATEQGFTNRSSPTSPLFPPTSPAVRPSDPQSAPLTISQNAYVDPNIGSRWVDLHPDFQQSLLTGKPAPGSQADIIRQISERNQIPPPQTSGYYTPYLTIDPPKPGSRTLPPAGGGLQPQQPTTPWVIPPMESLTREELTAIFNSKPPEVVQLHKQLANNNTLSLTSENDDPLSLYNTLKPIVELYEKWKENQLKGN